MVSDVFGLAIANAKSTLTGMIDARTIAEKLGS